MILFAKKKLIKLVRNNSTLLKDSRKKNQSLETFLIISYIVYNKLIFRFSKLFLKTKIYLKLLL